MVDDSTIRILESQILTRLCRDRPRIVVGVAGAQGSGKSTLACQLRDRIVATGIQSVVLSLDDFYLSHADRVLLSKFQHPLLLTRGVPGTHDMHLLEATVDRLLKSNGTVEWPKFSKAKDDREGFHWFDVSDVTQGLVVILEGWCVGCVPQADVDTPVNDLERFDDPDVHWRRFVQDSIRNIYLPVWSKLDMYIFLQVPDWDSVARWRTEQAVGNCENLSDLNIGRFVQFFERITKQMIHDRWKTDVVVTLNQDHSVATIVCEH